MSIVAALEAKDCTAITGNLIQHLADIVSFTAQLTIRVWTPSDILVIVSK